MDVDDVQAVHCFAATFRHPITNEPRSGILRVNALNQSLELFAVDGLVLSVSASQIICFQFDVRNPETQFTIYRRSQIPVDIQTASSDDSDQICVLLDALIASRPIAPSCKFLRSGQADLCGRTVTLILLGNAHIIFADGTAPILLINLAHTKIGLSRKTGITLTLLKGAEQDYLLDMKTERERQEWVVAFNRAMAIRKTPPGRQSIISQQRGPISVASPNALRSHRGSVHHARRQSEEEIVDFSTKESIMTTPNPRIPHSRQNSGSKSSDNNLVKDQDQNLNSSSTTSGLRNSEIVPKNDGKVQQYARRSLLVPSDSVKRLSLGNDDEKYEPSPLQSLSVQTVKTDPVDKFDDNYARTDAAINQTRLGGHLAKRDSLIKQIDIEPEPEPLRSPSFVAPISVQMKSIRTSYAAARSLVSMTSMKRASTAAVAETMPIRRKPDPDQEQPVKNEAGTSTKSKQSVEKTIKRGISDASGTVTTRARVTDNEAVPCVIISIESNGTLRPLTSVPNIIQLTARCAEAAAITTDGSILQWSFNDDGSVTGPVTIPHAHDVQFAKLSCGRDHHLAVSKPPLSQLYGWGRCSLLGMKGSVKMVTSTTLIPSLSDIRIKSLASAAKHTFIVSAQDEIWTWGGAGPWLGRDQSRHHFTPTPLATRLPSSVQLVACSTESSYVLTTSGRLFACGAGRHGRLGLGDCHDRIELCQVPVPAEIADVVPGGRHVVVQARSGQIYAWGCNAHGQLGISAGVKVSMSPVLVPAFSNNGVVKIACAKTATMALTRSADVLMCGSLPGNQILDCPTILELDPTVCGRVHDIVCGYQIALIMSEPPLPPT